MLKKHGRAMVVRFFAPPFFSPLYRERKESPRPVKKRKRTSETGRAFRAAIASEEASSIPFPPGRRKLHIRSLLLPSQIVTVSLGHNLAIWNFTTPHAVLMMAGRRHFADTVCMGTDPGKSILDSSDFLIRTGVVKFCRFCYDGWTNRGVFHAEMEANFVRSAASGGGFDLFLPNL